MDRKTATKGNAKDPKIKTVARLGKISRHCKTDLQIPNPEMTARITNHVSVQFFTVRYKSGSAVIDKTRTRFSQVIGVFGIME
jgi:hypothetical protein